MVVDGRREIAGSQMSKAAYSRLGLERRNYFSFAYPALACFRMGTSESASFRRARRARTDDSSLATAAALPSAPTQQTVGRNARDRAKKTLLARPVVDPLHRFLVIGGPRATHL
jgi:hypothetical protein